MKNILGIISAVAIVIIMAFGIANNSHQKNDDFLRIHIVANSNQSIDQNIKYTIKDQIVEYLIPYLSNCDTQNEAYKLIESKSAELEVFINSILIDNGLDYKASIKLCEENFPNRSYDGVVLTEGFYDALIIDLGEAKGDNWWCVVYPPLCFANPKAAYNLRYKSKIVEIINNFLSK